MKGTKMRKKERKMIHTHKHTHILIQIKIGQKSVPTTFRALTAAAAAVEIVFWCNFWCWGIVLLFARVTDRKCPIDVATLLHAAKVRRENKAPINIADPEITQKKTIPIANWQKKTTKIFVRLAYQPTQLVSPPANQASRQAGSLPTCQLFVCALTLICVVARLMFHHFFKWRFRWHQLDLIFILLINSFALSNCCFALSLWPKRVRSLVVTHCVCAVWLFSILQNMNLMIHHRAQQFAAPSSIFSP